jgi:hypothetical protein
VLAGLSRKSMLGEITGRKVSQRETASVAAALLAARNGARILRVHDVAATKDALAVWSAVDNQGVSMGRKYFGTDGVRGTVGEAPITPDFVMRLGYAAGTTLVAREHLPAGGSIRPC